MQTGPLYQKYLESGKVSTDTRQITLFGIDIDHASKIVDLSKLEAEALPVK